MAVLKVSGIVLPQREPRTFWIDGDRLRLDPVPHAETVVDGGFLLPGLVDVHTHPGSEQPGDPFDEELLRRHLTDHRDAGVLAVRTPGSVARLPGWAYQDAGLPRIQSAGRWLAPPEMFFAGHGRDVTLDELVAAAVEEATAANGWCKVIGDWMEGQEVPAELLRAVVEAVHGIGGRVAVHATTTLGCHHAVMAGADSLEHGMYLDPGLLDRMAAQGTALVPTLTPFARGVEGAYKADPSPRRDWFVRGWEGMFAKIRSAHEAGVTILAGTDSFPCGTVAGEVDLLIQAGLPVEVALGAACWTARSFLGLAGLGDGAPADLLAYDTDPVLEPAVLAHPSRIILRGKVIR
ncbi:amidohydrolase [Rhizocola hellebori]|uniref:Amidohydrolase n=1 Tax=Rhizocola hellebori TaxID=1392758 RepID=A0A8J3QIL7_9ACTN|nr:amidohydrolase family protein [Rhizocola hellebori]GIH10370.1 amidohydrolase [Rhizocola hellebori]